MRAIRGTAALLATLVVAACGWRGPALLGQPGLQFGLMSYYDGRALEENALCPQPRMTAITRADVVERTPERVVANVRYHWCDEGQSVDTSGGSKVGCDGFGERTFVFAPTQAGGLEVVGMSGPQRGS